MRKPDREQPPGADANEPGSDEPGDEPRHRTARPVTVGDLISPGLRSIMDMHRHVAASADVWRTQLAATTGTMTAVSRSIAGTMAAHEASLASVEAGLIKAEWAAPAQRVLAEFATATKAVQQAQMEHLLAPLVRQQDEMVRLVASNVVDLQRTIDRALDPIARIVAVNWHDQFQSWTAEERRLEAELRRYGWWAFPHWTIHQVMDAARVARERGKRVLDAYMCYHFREQGARELRALAAGWMEEEAFRNRRPIIADALRDHRARRYRVAIPTLMPTIEGITVDVFDPGSTATSPRRPYTRAFGDEGSVWSRLTTDAMLDTMTVFWRKVEFDKVTPYARTLNWHLILHGRIVRYGTEPNSLRVFLALDQLDSAIRTYRRREEMRTRKPA